MDSQTHKELTLKEEFLAVLEGLQELPEIDRAALLMRAQDGMAYEEISRALRTPAKPMASGG